MVEEKPTQHFDLNLINLRLPAVSLVVEMFRQMSVFDTDIRDISKQANKQTALSRGSLTASASSVGEEQFELQRLGNFPVVYRGNWSPQNVPMFD